MAEEKNRRDPSEPRTEQIDPTKFAEFFAGFATSIRQSIAEVDRRKLEAEAMAPHIIITNRIED